MGDPEELFGAVSYQGGGAAMHALRLTIGDAAFFAGSREWVSQHLDSSATTDDFQATMESVSGLDLDAVLRDLGPCRRAALQLPRPDLTSVSEHAFQHRPPQAAASTLPLLCGVGSAGGDACPVHADPPQRLGLPRP